MKKIILRISISSIRIFLRLYSIFPIKKNRVIFNSFVGKQYSCNPKAISEFLEKNYPDKFEIVWTFKDLDNFTYLKERNIKICKFRSLIYYYYKMTSKISVCNVAWGNELPKRKSQYVIQTWHGGGCYKKVGIDEKNSDTFQKKLILRNNIETDLFLSSSKFFEENVIRKSMKYGGEILKKGMPRNDILVNGADASGIIDKVLKRYHISKNEIIVLYAPTWRYDSDKTFEELDINKLIEGIRIKFNKPCKILYRAHDRTSAKMNKRVIDVTTYPDMQELLVASHILITDYSSSIWDYSFTYKPCFLYTPDLQQYIDSRGFEIDIHKWGFPVCISNDELKESIINFKHDKFIEKMKTHHKNLGGYESGYATEIVCERINKICFN